MSRAALLLCVFCSAAFAAQDETTPPKDRIPWLHETVGTALAQAKASKTLVLAYFWKDDSPSCIQFYRDTLCTDRSAEALADLVCVSVDVSTEFGAKLMSSHEVTTLPTMLFLTPDGQAQDAILGIINVEDLVAEVERIRRGEGTVGTLRSKVQASPDDLALRLLLSNKLVDMGATAEAAELVESIKRDDPKALTPTCAHILLLEKRDAVAMAADDSADPGTWKLKPLYDHVKKIRPTEVTFEGWNLVAEIELQRGDRRKAFAAWRQAHTHAGEGRLARLGTIVGNVAWAAPDDLRAFDKRFLLELAQELVEHFEANPVRVVENVSPDDQDVVVDLPSALELLARAHHITGRRTKALAALERAMELAPGRAYYNDRRAELDRL